MFYPMAAMALLIFIVTIINFYMRVASARRGKVDPRYFKLFQGEAPAHIIAGTRNYANLFEMPVLFFTLGILVMVLGMQTTAMVAMAWLYVGLRVIHSLIHMTRNKLLYRMVAFGASTLLLIAMWVLLIVQYTALGL